MKLSQKLGLAVLISTLFCSPLKADIDPAMIDGMTAAQWSDIDSLYTRGEVDLGAFRSVFLEPVSVNMRDRWLREQNRQRLSPQDRIRPEDEAQIRKELSEDLRARFTSALSQAGFVVADAAGPGTLTVKPTLLQVDVFDPNLSYRQSARRSTIPSLQAGSNQIATDMTLQLELFDGDSQSALVIAQDRLQARKVTSNIGLDITDRAANAVILDRWAAKLVQALNGADG